MPKPTAHALTWCQDTATYTVRDSEHDRTLAAIFGDVLTLTSEGQEWFAWLAGISSFEGRAGRFTARSASPACIDTPAAAPPTPTIALHASSLIPGQVMDIDIGKAPKAPPYDDTFWLPDRCHFPLV